MAKLFKLLFSFQGRISRKEWLLGTLIVILLSLVSAYLFVPGAFDFQSEAPPPVWTDTVMQLLLLVPTAAISIKRFADCNWPPWPVYILTGSLLIFALGPHFGLFSDLVHPNNFEFAFLLLVGLLTFALWIANALVPGSRGANRYGDEPDSAKVSLHS